MAAAPGTHAPAGTAGVPQPRLLAWQREGTGRFESAAAALSDGEFAGASALPGWSRAHLVAHLARNADALVNLLDWARTGVPSPMYREPGRREADIAADALLSPGQLRAGLLAADRRLAAAAASLPDAAWAVRVRSAQGREIPAADVPWLRVREVWIHLVDLAVGVGFDEVPGDLLGPLLDDVTATLGRRGAPGVTLGATDGTRGTWIVGDGGPADAAVTGRGSELLRWATGRPAPSSGTGPTCAGQALPDLPRWL